MARRARPGALPGLRLMARSSSTRVMPVEPKGSLTSRATFQQRASSSAVALRESGDCAPSDSDAPEDVRMRKRKQIRLSLLRAFMTGSCVWRDGRALARLGGCAASTGAAGVVENSFEQRVAAVGRSWMDGSDLSRMSLQDQAPIGQRPCDGCVSRNGRKTWRSEPVTAYRHSDGRRSRAQRARGHCAQAICETEPAGGCKYACGLGQRPRRHQGDAGTASNRGFCEGLMPT